MIGREILLNEAEGGSRVGAHIVIPRFVARLLAAVLALGTAFLVACPERSAAAEFLLHVGDVRVATGTVVHGDVIALAGSVFLAGTVEGNAVAVGGNVDVSGHVEGSVRAQGGDVILRATGIVDGQATAVGGQVRREPGSSLGGATPPAPQAPPSPRYRFPPPWVQPMPRPPYWWPGPRPEPLLFPEGLLRFLYFSSLIGFIGFAWILAVLFPGALSRLATALERAPAASFGAGLLGWLLSLLIPVLLILSVVGLMFLFLVPMAVILAVLFGTTAVALVIGRRIRRFGVVQNVVVGAVLLAVAFSVPRLGGLVAFLAATLGLGAVLVAFAEGRRPSAVPPSPPASPTQA